MRLIQSFFVILLLCLASVATAQNVGNIDFQTVDVGNLSEQRIQAIYESAQARGMSIDQTVQLAVAQGLPQSQASELRRRLQGVRGGGEGAGQAGAGQTGRQRSGLDLQEAHSVFDNVFGGGTGVDSLRLYRTIELVKYQSRQDSLNLVNRKLRDRIFGYELFRVRRQQSQQFGGVGGQGQQGSGQGFQPELNLPTPENYVLASGDEVIIDIWGAAQMTYQLEISPDGMIMIQNLGPVHLNGLTINEARDRLMERLGSIYSGLNPANESQKDTYMQISLGQIRSINVTVMGEATMPGTFTIPSLATVFNALYAAAGPNTNGSFRHVNVIRGDSVAATFDLYDVLINGDRSGDVMLRSQDMIQVKPYQNRVAISGQVKRPGLYEMKEDETLADLITYAGDFTDQAYTDRVTVFGNTPKEKQVADVGREDFGSFDMNSGDSVHVGRILDRFANVVEIEGAVYRPGKYEVNENTSLHSLIQRADGLKEDAFMSRGLIYREQEDFTIETIAFSLREVMQNPAQNDIQLRPRDVVKINSIFDMRQDYTIRVSGPVQEPDTFAFRYGMTLEDAIFQAGGFKESAAPYQIEVARRIRDLNQETVSTGIADIFSFEVSEDLQLTERGSQFELSPFDRIYVRQLPNYEEQQEIHIMGQVRFPGKYTLSDKNERISDIIERAGGLTPEAYIDGASLFRKRTETQQQAQRTVTNNTQNDGDGGNGDGNQQQSEAQAEALQEALSTASFERKTQVGINLSEVVEDPESKYDLYLQAGDSLFVPKTLQTVTIEGGVYHETTVRYDPGFSFRDYISQAGGYTQLARNRRAYVVYSNGEVSQTTTPLAIFRNYPDVRPGATITVPEKPEGARLTPQERVSLLSAIVSTAALITTTIIQITR